MASLKTKPLLPLKKHAKNASSGDKIEETYVDSLSTLERERYYNKVSVIKGQDPYEIVLWSTDQELFPSVTYMDVVNYLVFSPSPYTKEDLRCYKGLSAYNQFVAGWVRDVGCCQIAGKCVVTAKVLHSQSIGEKPLRPWVICEKDGVILSAHCTCMAGLGETCTHVASVLFYMEAAVKIRQSKTVTEEAAYWKLPSAFHHASYEKLKKIDFTSASTQKKRFDQTLNSHDQPETPKAKKQVLPPTQSQIELFLQELNSSKSKPVVLSIMPNYADKYVPEVLQCDLPLILTELCSDEAQSLEYNDLLKTCKEIEVSVSKEQSDHVEAITRDQSKNRLWYRFRSGRITASKEKSVCKTNIDQPSQHLIQSICYPEAATFQSEATKWGCKHEETARMLFTQDMSKTHANVQVKTSGFILSSKYPYIGASPDAIIKCDCCGWSTVEIKCPFCVKNSTLSDISDKTFCLQRNENNKLQLKTDHAYNYQVQAQIGVCDQKSGYFVLWTQKDLHIEQISLDEAMWSEICAKSEQLFWTAILPELVGKFFTKKADSQLAVAKIGSTEDLFCYCRDIEHGEMVGCDNADCKYEWFHFACVGIKSEPKGIWYCPDCRKLDQFRKKRKAR